MFIAVDLPDPLGPMIETNSPRSIAEVDAAKRRDRRVARAVELGHPAECDQRIVRAAPVASMAALIIPSGLQ